MKLIGLIIPLVIRELYPVVITGISYEEGIINKHRFLS